MALLSRRINPTIDMLDAKAGAFISRATGGRRRGAKTTLNGGLFD